MFVQFSFSFSPKAFAFQAKLQNNSVVAKNGVTVFNFPNENVRLYSITITSFGEEKIASLRLSKISHLQETSTLKVEQTERDLSHQHSMFFVLFASFSDTGT